MKSVPLTFDAYASWKSILRHHPFFQAGGTFGYDFRTMNVCYPDDCRVLKAVIVAANNPSNP